MKKILCLASSLVLVCFQVVWADVHIMTINDFHGWVEESGSSPGMAKLAVFMNDYRRRHPDTVVVSAGDNYQGEALSTLSRGDLVNALFGLVGLQFSAVGNHEFDWGTEHFARWNASGVQYLAANVVDRKTGQAPAWVTPYAIVQAGGKKIALIGLSTRETPGSTAPKHIKGLRFEDAALSARRWIRHLKQGRDRLGAPDAVILLSHVPSFQDRATGLIFGDELSALTGLKGVDAIITGHSHKRVTGRHRGVPVVQAGWVELDRQVGQSGKTVRPKLYIAAGISGAIQHRVGMEGADCIIAINNDPNAPIFDFAHYGIVGDAMTILPALTEAFRQKLATLKQAG
ncbi:MAG TPA: FAD-binding protein [Deltaproteobacteria bacterium]|nr:FAD-binding protein [Deltaproteobacteria bacterium]